MERCLILYRGPLERSRLAFVLEVAFASYQEVRFVWIFPGQVSEAKRMSYKNFFASYRFAQWDLFQHTAMHFGSTRRELRPYRLGGTGDLLLVGTTAGVFARGMESLRTIWFINGIPEEHGMVGYARVNQLRSSLLWWINRLLCRTDLIITVSNRMNTYLRARIGNRRMIAVPTCVDLKIFTNREDRATKRFVYLGTGAAWQAMDLLTEVWRQIYELDQDISFRVISRDERTRILAKGVPEHSIEFVDSDDFETVAGLLGQCGVGFLLRKPNIVNEVSFPTKFGEYVASHCWVVGSDLNWDISDYVRRYKVGTLLDSALSPCEMARQILGAYADARKDPSLEARFDECAMELGRDKWVIEMATAMTNERKIRGQHA